MDRMIRCALEQDEFPEAEFEDTPEYGLVHRRGRDHTTLGEYLDEEPLPGEADAEFPEDDE